MPRRMPKDFDVAPGRIEKPKKHFDRGRFSRAIRPEQAKDFPAANFEIDVIDRASFGTAPKIFEDFGQSPDRYHHVVSRSGLIGCACRITDIGGNSTHATRGVSWAAATGELGS